MHCKKNEGPVCIPSETKILMFDQYHFYLKNNCLYTCKCQRPRGINYFQQKGVSASHDFHVIDGPSALCRAHSLLLTFRFSGVICMLWVHMGFATERRLRKRIPRSKANHKDSKNQNTTQASRNTPH
jgi:hypothetical protein